MLLEAYQVLTGKVSKGAKEGIYKNGFFFSAGLFAGIGLNDLFRMTGSDVNYKKITVAGPNYPELKETHQDEVLQYGIVAVTVLLSVFSGKYLKEVIPMAAGAATGIAWSNRAERGNQSLSLLPF